jgi:nucleotide sugar dehydrogenase
MRIGIVGFGFVGTAVYSCFMDHFAIEVFDIDGHKDPTCFSIRQLVETGVEVIFVCVPTPMKTDGQCDTRIVEWVVREINNHATDRIEIVIKSTSTPGTTARLQAECPNHLLVFNPEFLTERNAVLDFQRQDHIVLGMETVNQTTTRTEQVYKTAFPYVPQMIVPSAEAELLKYVTNTFLAMKVTFANEIESLCRTTKISYNVVKTLLKADDRLGTTHWDVPGPDGEHGFGGTCFPKDLNALIAWGVSEGAEIELLQAVWDKNLKLRPNADWEKLKGRAISDSTSELPDNSSKSE